MNANELANKSFMELWDSYTSKKMECEDLHEKICQQQAEINQQQEEKKALYNLVVEQDKKIVELAFKLAYAERGNEIVLEANTRSRP